MHSFSTKEFLLWTLGDHFAVEHVRIQSAKTVRISLCDQFFQMRICDIFWSELQHTLSSTVYDRAFFFPNSSIISSRLINMEITFPSKGSKFEIELIYVVIILNSLRKVNVHDLTRMSSYEVTISYLICILLPIRIHQMKITYAHYYWFSFKISTDS